MVSVTSAGKSGRLWPEPPHSHIFSQSDTARALAKPPTPLTTRRATGPTVVLYSYGSLHGEWNQPLWKAGEFMAHNIINDMSWVASQLHENPDGWSLELGPATVARLTFSHDFTIELDGGARIVISEPFWISKETGTLQVSPREESSEAIVRQLLHRSIEQTTVTPAGALEIISTADNSPELKMNADSRAWKVYFSNGSTCCALPNGGLELFPPRDVKRLT